MSLWLLIVSNGVSDFVLLMVMGVVIYMVSRYVYIFFQILYSGKVPI